MGIKERKEREKEQRRNLIIDAAQKVIFRKGLENTTIEDIAAEAEFAKGTLYLYFKNKEAIHYEINKRGARLLDERLKAMIHESKNGLENIISLGWEFVKFAREEQGFFHLFLFFHSIDFRDIDITSSGMEDFIINDSPFKTFIDLVGKGIKDGSVRNDLPALELATSLWSTMMGLLVVQENKREIYDVFKVNPENILKTSFEILLNGIRNKN